MKILSADDDKDLLALIGFTLSQAGYLVVKASDGPSAIKAFEAESPDLVILDINMPGASGFQVCEAVRSKSRVPVMMLTVRGEEEDLVKALELGADDYLTKPFSPRTLLARVKALLRRAGMENSAPLAAGRNLVMQSRVEPSRAFTIPIVDGQARLQLEAQCSARAAQRQQMRPRLLRIDVIGRDR